MSLSAAASVVASLLLGASTMVAQSEAQPITEETIELAAGAWVDDSNGVPIEFTVEDGWLDYGVPIPEVGVGLGHSEYPDALLTITSFYGDVFSGPCATADNAAEFFEGSGIATVEASAQGLADHLDAHPYVTVTESTPVEVDGYSGLQIDTQTSVPAECEPHWAWLWALPVVQDFHLNDGMGARFIALDVGEHVTVLAAETLAGDPESWASFLDEFTAMIDSMVITPA